MIPNPATLRHRECRAVVGDRETEERSVVPVRGGTVVERETQRLDVNGKLQTVDISRTRESGPS